MKLLKQQQDEDRNINQNDSPGNDRFLCFRDWFMKDKATEQSKHKHS